jgi:hypothetical protein
MTDLLRSLQHQEFTVMSLIKNITNDWSEPVVLAADEIWQARWGSVFVTTTANPDPEDGFRWSKVKAC